MSDEILNKKIFRFLMVNEVNIIKKEWLEECIRQKRIVPSRDPRYEIKKKDVVDQFSSLIESVKSKMRKSMDPNLNTSKFSVTTRISLTPEFSLNAAVLFRRVYNICDLDFLSLRVQFLVFEFVVELLIMGSMYAHDRGFRKKLGEEEYFFILRMMYRSQIIENIIMFLKSSVRMAERKKKMFFRFLNLLMYEHIRHVELKMCILENLLFFLDDSYELQNEHYLIILKIIQSDEFVSTFSHDTSAVDDPSGGGTQNIVLSFILEKVCKTRIMELVMERVFANTVHNVPLVRRILRFKLADGMGNKNILIEILLTQVHKYSKFILRNLGKIEKMKSVRNNRSRRRRKRRRKKKKVKKRDRGRRRRGMKEEEEEEEDEDEDDDEEEEEDDYDEGGGDEYHTFLLDILFSKFLINLPGQLEKKRLSSILYLHLHLFDEKKLIHFDELVFELVGREQLDISFFHNFSNRQVLLAKHYLKMMYYARRKRFNEKEKLPFVKKFLVFRREFDDYFFRSSKKRKRKGSALGGRASPTSSRTHKMDSSNVIEEIKQQRHFQVDETMVRANVKNSRYPDTGLDIVVLTDVEAQSKKEMELSRKYPELFTFEEAGEGNGKVEEEEEEEEEEEDENEEEEKIRSAVYGGGGDGGKGIKRRRRRRKKQKVIPKKFKTPIIFTEDDFDSKRTFVHMGLKEVVFGLVQNECYKCFTRIHPRMKCSKCDRVMCKDCFNAYFDEDAWEKYLFSETFVCTECESKKRKLDEIYEGGKPDDGDRVLKKRKLD